MTRNLGTTTELEHAIRMVERVPVAQWEYHIEHLSPGEMEDYFPNGGKGVQYILDSGQADEDPQFIVTRQLDDNLRIVSVTLFLNKPNSEDRLEIRGEVAFNLVRGVESKIAALKALESAQDSGARALCDVSLPSLRGGDET